jgi:hypothetical protein
MELRGFLVCQPEDLVELRGGKSAVDLGSSGYDVGQQLDLAAKGRVRDLWFVATAHDATV